MPKPTRAEGLAVLRAVYLVFGNEFRLLTRDRVSLFMLFLAPIVIIAVAGFSLGNLYGVGRRTRVYVIAVVNQDHGPLAAAIIARLKREPSLQIAPVDDLQAARALMLRRDRAPLALIFPPGLSQAYQAGKLVSIEVEVDPIRRIEASAIELQLQDLLIGIDAAARNQAQVALADATAQLSGRLERLASRAQALQSEAAAFRDDLKHRQQQLQRELQAHLQAGVQDQIARLQAETQAELERSLGAARADLGDQLKARRVALLEVQRYLRALQTSEGEFRTWLENLRTAAGSYADRIPPPPSWPPPPDPAQVAILSKPVAIPALSIPHPTFRLTPDLLRLPRMELHLPEPGQFAINPAALLPAAPPTLPGTLQIRERALSTGTAEVNTFDQYVPGFGITFLLVDMLWGVAVGLIDERDWGTLERMRVSGAPVSGILMGRLLARFIIGLGQLIVLFAVGWLLFGITLGRTPAMLLLPAAGISFAAATFGLIIACVARTHDAIIPIGAVSAMTMSAIGGCWWPLDFEPGWMRALAQWMPTTWTMRAFNDLMIRGLEPASALRPVAITFGLGVLCLLLGILGRNRLYE